MSLSRVESMSTCCSTFGLVVFVGIGQNAIPIHLVLQRVETKVECFLRACLLTLRKKQISRQGTSHRRL